jgi:uncharacterized membrane protein YkoI
MSRRTFLLVTTTIVGLSAGSLTGALAEQSGNDALQLRGAKISLTDAIAAAEAKTGGRASRAELTRSADGWVYNVEIVASDTVSDVEVNPENGSVMSVSEDKVDHDEDEDDAED